MIDPDQTLDHTLPIDTPDFKPYDDPDYISDDEAHGALLDRFAEMEAEARRIYLSGLCFGYGALFVAGFACGVLCFAFGGGN